MNKQLMEEMLDNAKEKLLALEEELHKKMNDSSIDFVNDYDLEVNENNYIDDSFHSFADSSTSIYYSSQRGFYFKHSDLCDKALLEWYSSEDIAKIIKEQGLDVLICKAGAIGEYQTIFNELCEDGDEIVQCLAIKYALKHLELIVNFDEVYEKIENIGVYDARRFRDIITILFWIIGQDKKIEGYFPSFLFCTHPCC